MELSEVLLTHALCTFGNWTLANSVEPDQMPQNNDQDLHCLLTECTFKILMKL